VKFSEQLLAIYQIYAYIWSDRHTHQHRFAGYNLVSSSLNIDNLGMKSSEKKYASGHSFIN